jgi:hypothetical protein
MRPASTRAARPWCPLFFAQDADAGRARLPNRREQRLLLAVMRGLILTHAAGELVVKSIAGPASRLLEITVEGEVRNLRASAKTSRWGGPSLDCDVPELDVPPGLPRTDQHWIAGVLDGLEISAEHLDGERIVMLADARTDDLIDQCLAPLDGGTQALALLSAVIRGESSDRRLGYPAQVDCADEQLFVEIAPTLEAAGVQCRRVEDYPRFDALASLLRSTDPRALLGDRDRFGESRLPDSLFGWKAADLRITRRLCALADVKPKSVGRAIARFFGTEKVGAEVLRELQRLQPMGSFMEWLMTDYRSTVRSKTFLEKRLLDKQASLVERALIEARMSARVSIYRVVATRPGEAIDLEDVFDGTKFTVQERALSGCDIDGCFLPLRVMKVAEWRFITMAGPPISAHSIARILEYLDQAGVGLSAESLRRQPHVLGWLWAFLLPRNQSAPTMCNTDGDPFVWHTATFRMADPAAAAKALSAKADVRFDEQEGDWTWWRAGGPTPGFGDNTTLGRIEIIDDRLVLEVNSAARCARARKWIEALPGVRFERVTERQVRDPGRPLDDSLPQRPEQASPEMVELMRAAHAEYSRRWLDLPLPTLGGRTPRQACKDAAGRKRVELLIRTMPAAGSPGGPIEPPREELLRELGPPVGN